MEDSDRETAIGFFNVAHSYHVSAHALHSHELDCTHGALPIEFLCYHSLERYLKSFLMTAGFNAKQLSKRRFGHNLSNLAETADTHGLVFRPTYKKIIKQAHNQNNVIEARYFKKRVKRKIKVGALLAACQHLHHLTVEPVYRLYPHITRRPKLEALDPSILKDLDLPEVF